jgi:adenylate cyclase
MSRNNKRFHNTLPAMLRYKLQWTIIIAIAWTIIDLFIYYRQVSDGISLNNPYHENILSAYLLRSGFAFVTSWFIAYLLLINLGSWMQQRQLLASWFIKAIVLTGIVLVISVILFFAHYLLVLGLSMPETIQAFRHYAFKTTWLTDGLISRIILILATQVIFEIDQKYSPGVFWYILTGRYRNPRNEQRIIMFLDLKDSTPISEQLGHEKYFLFIRDFIFHISNAGLENNGRIYQYVGDEVIFSWTDTEKNSYKCIDTIIAARRNIQRYSSYFREKYSFIPEFRVGIHTGPVTVGEIGVIKKDIAMSGEAMNITARIRSACSELNQKYIVSENYFTNSTLQQWQGEDLGTVSLKGLEKHPIRLYALKI